MNRLELFAATLSQGEGAMVSSSIHRFYLTGFTSSAGTLYVTPAEVHFFLDSRYLEMAKIAQGKGEIPGEVVLHGERFGTWFEKRLSEKREERIFFEDRVLSVKEWEDLKKQYPTATFVPLGDRLEQMRVVKSEEEIAGIRAAQALAEAAFEFVLPHLAPGRTETEIAAELEYYMRRNGAKQPSFSTICVSGTASSLPHGEPRNVPMEKNVFVTMDFGCQLDGYMSDMTRTVCLGKATDEMKHVYQTVLQAQLSALSTVRAGVKGCVVDAAARNHIAKEGYGECFGHTTGHGIGLQVHEAPSFAPRYDGEIPEGAVLSVEPGIYLEGKFGVRIEDLVVVRKDGGENLNRSSKELLEI